MGEQQYYCRLVGCSSPSVCACLGQSAIGQLDSDTTSRFSDSASFKEAGRVLQLAVCIHLLDFYVFFPREKKAICEDKDAITDRGLIAFLKHCPNLQQLSMISSPNITDVSLYLIFQHCKKL